ncbi:MAG TPA: hypothetical protein VNT99_17430 [Methylomirabilota bacterium]|nr:hypothetical protein [Methylomirabilota bacterium]
MSNPSYQKLPGRGLAWSGPSRVWLGEDHVLLVLTRGYLEVYRRFFLNDIQALIVLRTQTGKIWNGVCAFFSALFLWPALALGETGTIITLSLAAPFLATLLINVLRGPTCAFYIRTAVQTERVPAVSRVRAAEKFIARVEPLVKAAQGEWPEPFVPALATLQSSQPVVAGAPPVLGL